MRRCCFLTMESTEGYVTDDELAVPAFERAGWKVEFVPWTRETDWNRFEAAVIRTTWDYHLRPWEFVSALRSIQSLGVTVLNDPGLVEWNVRKTYLGELEERGVKIVPSVFGAGPFPDEALDIWFEEFDAEDLVIKPVVSATAMDTYRLTRGEQGVPERFSGREFLVQPFVRSIVDEGEFSLFYFNGRFSHAILKKPKSGDFRVQEEYGGTPLPFVPDEDLIEAGGSALEALGSAPLYCRVDLARGNEGGFLLMELELIEPALYFRTDPGAADLFAAAFDHAMSG